MLARIEIRNAGSNVGSNYSDTAGKREGAEGHLKKKDRVKEKLKIRPLYNIWVTVYSAEL